MSHKKEDRNRQIANLALGLGPLSPSGQDKWKDQEIADHFAISRPRVRQILKHLNVSRKVEKVRSKQVEIDKIGLILGDITDELLDRDWSNERPKDMSIAAKNLAEIRERNEKVVERTLDMDKLFDEVAEEALNGTVIDAEFKEVKDANGEASEDISNDVAET